MLCVKYVSWPYLRKYSLTTDDANFIEVTCHVRVHLGTMSLHEIIKKNGADGATAANYLLPGGAMTLNHAQQVRTNSFPKNKLIEFG